ncbi:hypothetical protein GCK72_023636 [Caenorhabditis remanei]|uniref:Uncharacterized protein n=1 Tax=Caenorhabditis remanei TaxID=31234 RepID=A0A6A5FXD2_CAERE|nr:hypothetical protein GCK72_023636 [Caenorhabditis remanei]KAF1747175.1 hypothetical protein GCK72_023636 [Caenorhabditis remanei]
MQPSAIPDTLPTPPSSAPSVPALIRPVPLNAKDERFRAQKALFMAASNFGLYAKMTEETGNALHARESPNALNMLQKQFGGEGQTPLNPFRAIGLEPPRAEPKPVAPKKMPPNGGSVPPILQHPPSSGFPLHFMTPLLMSLPFSGLSMEQFATQCNQDLTYQLFCFLYNSRIAASIRGLPQLPAVPAPSGQPEQPGEERNRKRKNTEDGSKNEKKSKTSGN